MQRTFENPILPGCYPDPSICRVEDDYYLVTSSFEYFPGMPIFHSRDLVHWRQLGHVLDRPSQLALDGIRPSGGLYAPTIRWHQGVFYVINTLVDGTARSGNFIVTATDPAGPWSEPYWLDEAVGFDPSLFFDEDGRTWYTENRVAFEGHYEGHTEIWMQELDIQQMRLTGEAIFLWDGADKKAIWSEAAHIYKKDGYYYLMTSEGGTAHHHSVVIARSEQITGPYEGNRGNPILTHRHLGLDYPIVGTGHADLVETQNGEWWMVLLGMRPYGGYFYNLGRETFLVPVRWEDDWPVVNPGVGKVEFCSPAPDLQECIWPQKSDQDDFDQPKLSSEWNFRRTPREVCYSLVDRPGFLRLKLRPEKLSERVFPSFVGRRQQHINFLAATLMDFSPGDESECAGMSLVQNENYHYLFTVQKKESPVIQLIRRLEGIEDILAEKQIPEGKIYLKVQTFGQNYFFYYGFEPELWTLLAGPVDGRILSTPVAGGFVGAYIGLYASSNGKISCNHADFDWFKYQEIENIPASF